jgi:hypothetical protein
MDANVLLIHVDSHADTNIPGESFPAENFPFKKLSLDKPFDMKSIQKLIKITDVGDFIPVGQYMSNTFTIFLM